jgi:hypothetical protein
MFTGMEEPWESEEDFLSQTTAAIAAGVPVNVTNDDGDTQLALAAVHDLPRAAELLLEQYGADPNIADRNGYRALHFAGDARTIELLLKHGADVDAQNNNGETPLMMGFILARVELVRILLRNGASCRLRNDRGQTALEFAKLYVNNAGAQVDPNRRQASIDLLTAVTNAGSWERYLREPVVQLLCLRHLCLAGRATAPPTLVRCFGAPPVPNAGKARTRARRVAAATPLPDEVFALILSFWHWRT